MSVHFEFFSPAADRNKAPILEVLKEFISEDDRRVLEIGVGTGQHAIEFAQNFPWLTWATSDVASNVERIESNEPFKSIPNIDGPYIYECGKDRPPQGPFDVYYTANTFHIMSWKSVKSFFKDLEGARAGAKLFVYGPFAYEKKELENSNKMFHESLKDRDPQSGLRKFEDVIKQASKRGFRLLKDYEMPANNRLLSFIKI